jgi:UDP-2,3-diacylglucosamine pyrophosphatase LpxH
MCAGNHDWPGHYYDRILQPYKETGVVDKKGKKLKIPHYSYDIGNAHIISVNSEMFLEYDVWKKHNNQQKDTFDILRTYFHGEQAPEELIWLINDLKNVPKDKFIIIFLHYPVYCSLTTEKEEKTFGQVDKYTIMLKNNLQPVFENYDIDLIISGHVHIFEDIETKLNNKKGPRYIICGAAGSKKGFYDSGYDSKGHWMKEKRKKIESGEREVMEMEEEEKERQEEYVEEEKDKNGNLIRKVTYKKLIARAVGYCEFEVTKDMINGKFMGTEEPGKGKFEELHSFKVVK